MVPFLKIHAEQDALGPKSLQRSVQELVFWLISVKINANYGQLGP
jgi:hypothetical protein